MIKMIKLKKFGSPLTLPVLKLLIEKAAKNMYTLTYGEVCQMLGINNDGLAIRHALFHIQRFCDNWNLPRINYLVVNKKTGRPGTWVTDKLTESGWRAAVIAAYSFDWSLVVIEPSSDEPMPLFPNESTPVLPSEEEKEAMRKAHVEKYGQGGNA